MTPPRVALLTTECAQVGAAIEEIVRRHPDHLALVVTSQLFPPQRGGLIAQAATNLRRCGPGFLAYLLCSFFFDPWWLRYDWLRSQLTGRPRRRRSVAELCNDAGAGAPSHTASFAPRAGPTAQLKPHQKDRGRYHDASRFGLRQAAQDVTPPGRRGR